MAGQLIRRGENTWCVRGYTGRDAHGKRTYINQTVHGTKRQADQELRKLLAQRDTGRLHVKPKQSVDESSTCGSRRSCGRAYASERCIATTRRYGSTCGRTSGG